MISGSSQAEQRGVVVTVDLSFRIRRDIERMLRRLLIAQEHFREVIGNSRHGIGAFSLMRQYLQVVMLGLDGFYGIAQMLNRANILSDAGHCVPNIGGVVGRSGWRRLIGWKVRQDAFVGSLRKVACSVVEVI